MQGLSKPPQATRPATSTATTLPSASSSSSSSSSSSASSASASASAHAGAVARPSASTQQLGPEMFSRGRHVIEVDSAIARVPRIELPGRQLVLVREGGPSSTDRTLRGRRAQALEFGLRVEYADAPGEPIKENQLRHAFVVPPDCPPGLRADLMVGDQVLELMSGRGPSGQDSRSGRHAAAPYRPTAQDKVFAAQFVAQGFLPIPLTAPGHPRHDAQAEPVYGYLKLFADEGEMSPDEDGVRDDDPPTHWVRSSSSSSASTAPAADEERSSRARSARSRQREQKRRAAGLASESSSQPGSAVVLHRATVPILGSPTAGRSAPLAVEDAVPSQAHPAEPITPGASQALQGRDAPKRTLRTSFVTPHDFPPDLSIKITVGDQTRVVRIGPDGDLVSSAAGRPWIKWNSRQPFLDGVALEAQGYSPVNIQVPKDSGSSRSRAAMKTYTVYIKNYFVEVREGHEDVEVASGGKAPEESSRKRAARLRKREARRRAALRQHEAAAGAPSLAASASASASASSSAPVSGNTPGQE